MSQASGRLVQRGSTMQYASGRGAWVSGASLRLRVEVTRHFCKLRVSQNEASSLILARGGAFCSRKRALTCVCEQWQTLRD